MGLSTPAGPAPEAESGGAGVSVATGDPSYVEVGRLSKLFLAGGRSSLLFPGDFDAHGAAWFVCVSLLGTDLVHATPSGAPYFLPLLSRVRFRCRRCAEQDCHSPY
jgi:hypothetical protein